MSLLLRQNSKFFLWLSALLCLGAGITFFWYSYRSSQSAVVWGQVLHERGQVFKVTASGERQRISLRQDFFINEKVITDDIGRAILEWQDGSRWLVLEDSELFLYLLAGEPTLKIKKGQLQALKWNQKPIFQIQNQHDQILSIAHYLDASSDGAQPKTISTAAPASNPSAVGLAGEDKIQIHLQKLRPQFVQCYSDYLKLSNEASRYFITARFHYHFRQGVRQLSLSSQPLLPKSLEDCLHKVLQSFFVAQYRGPGLDIELPIEFE